MVYWSVSHSKLIYEPTGTSDDGTTIMLETAVPVRRRVKVQLYNDANNTAPLADLTCSSNATSVPVSPDVIDEAREVRAYYRTNDPRLTNFNEVLMATL